MAGVEDKKKTAEISFTSTLHNGQGDVGISVISKNKISDTPENYAALRDKFKKIEENRLKEERKTADEENSKDDEKDKKIKEALINNDDSITNRKIVLITHFNVFMYATCFWIQTGTLPYLTKKLGADPVMFGQLQTVFAIAQLVGGPVYGRLGDLWGERTALISAFTASVLTYLLTAVSYSLPMLFLSRVPSVLLHVMQGSQMVVTVLSSPGDRAVALARLGFSYGVGMVVGPTVGGVVTVHLGGEHAAALVSAMGSALSLALVVIYVPNIAKQELKEEDKKPSSSLSVLNVKEILSLLLIPEAGTLLLIKTVCGIPIGIFQSMFSVIAMEQFQLPADQNGLLLSYIGALSMVMQGVGISAATSMASDRTLLKISSAMLIVSYYLLSLLTTLTEFLALQVPLVCSLSLINSILQSSLTKVVPVNQTGTMLGLNMAVHSVIRTVAPTLGGLMMASSLGYPSIGYLGMACSGVVLGAVKIFDIK